MPNWTKLFEKGLLEKCGKKVSTTSDLATALSKETKELITVDALFNAHKRYKSRLSLQGSLVDYMGKLEEKEKKPKTVRPEDIIYSLSKDRKKRIRNAKRFIITSAQNNAALDMDVWNSINVYAKENDAEIIVIPIRYRNPTSPQECKVYQAWWPEEIEPYATDELVKLHEHLWVMGHVRVQPTATSPLSGLESLSKGASAVFGHPQLAMEMVATPQNKLPKVMYTTGSTSVREYSDSRAGVNGEFHHSRGAVIVETDGPRFYIRSVTNDRKNGGFYDLNKYYSPDRMSKSDGALALITGDEHAMINDSKCRAATYLDKNSIVNTLRPKKIVRHDVFDGYSISHHNRKDPVIQYSKHMHGHHLVERELELTLKHIESTTPDWAENIIVSSNHHGHLLRWMKEVNAPTEEPWNAKAWLSLWSSLIESVSFKEHGIVHEDPLAVWITGKSKVPVRFLAPDESYMVSDVEVGMHGHNGINGSKGNINQFAKIGVKSSIAHVHKPGIRFGCHQVGTSTTLKLDYTKGPSSWAHAHNVIHPNGKRQMLFVVDGHWTTLV